MNDRFQTYIHENFIGIMFTILCLVIAGMYVFCGRTTTSSTAQQIKQDTNGAGASISQAKVENGVAGNAVDRASNSVREVRERTDRSKAELKEARAILDQCIELNRKAQVELGEIRKANQ